MAADVSSLIRVLAGGVYKDDKHRTVGNESNSERSPVLITRDLLGGSSKSVVESQELDLDLQVPNGWEKRLDLKSAEHHKHVRKEIVKQLKDHRSFYECYVPMKYKQYCKKMAKSGEWGDHVTLQEAADKRIQALVEEQQSQTTESID